MKYCLLIIILQLSILGRGQNIKYACKSTTGMSAKILVTPSAKPLDYQGKKVTIYKYEITASNQKSLNFFIYQFNNKLFILDSRKTSLNHTSDPVIFSMPHEMNYSIHVPDVMPRSALILKNNTKVNGYGIYKYEVLTNKQDLAFSSLTFDHNMSISEFGIKDGAQQCTCTQDNIKIQLKQR